MSGSSSLPPPTTLVRRIGVFDATMLVMGGIIGSGIFINPYVVARQVHTSFLILGAWVFGGLTAMIGAFVYAELAVLRPNQGGQYAYLRDAYHPAVAFLFGWALLLVMQTGGMAAVAVTFARYAEELLHTGLSESLLAVLVLAALSGLNCLGVKLGSTFQSVLMMLKIGAIGALVAFGFSTAKAWPAVARTPERSSGSLTASFGAALVPVLFAYGGWHTTSFITGEMRNPKRDLARALLIGVAGVTAIYLSVNFVCLRVLGPAGLAATTTPAYTVMNDAAGGRGGFFIACAIAISTLGFLSQGMLTAPRVYFTMARDRLFFRSIAHVSKTTHVPAAAIVLQGVCAAVIALSGKYEQILNYVVSIDFLFTGLTGLSLFIFRRRSGAAPEHRTPGHPFTNIFFVAACWAVVAATFFNYPANSAVGLAIVLLGVPVYFYWKRRQALADR